MKLQRLFLVSIVLFISFPFCFSQTKPKTELVEEITNNVCEDFSAITDSFLTNLSDEPDSTGYAIIYPTKKTSGKGVWYEKIIIKSAFSRKLNNQLKIIHGESRENFKVDFWKVPKDAEKPEFVESNWSDNPHDASKPFLFDNLADDGACQTFVPELYANFIKTNLTIRGNIIIHDSSKLGKQEKVKEWLKTLVQDLNVPRNRFKFSFANDINHYPYVEFWIVPQKR